VSQPYGSLRTYFTIRIHRISSALKRNATGVNCRTDCRLSRRHIADVDSAFGSLHRIYEGGVTDVLKVHRSLRLRGRSEEGASVFMYIYVHPVFDPEDGDSLYLRNIGCTAHIHEAQGPMTRINIMNYIYTFFLSNAKLPKF
jgi:hypothetical protein